MRILIAPTAFKGTFSPAELAEAILSGVNSFSEQSHLDVYIDSLPLADGGDGTIEALSLSSGVMKNRLLVRGQDGEPRTAYWLKLGDELVVELASACGIAALRELRPMAADTRGLGELMRHLLETEKFSGFVIALGGSASTDGGAGALHELGVRFFDAAGDNVVPAGGGSLKRIARLDLSRAESLLSGKRLRIACDVNNPLLGGDGAAYVFAPQKGADPEQVKELDSALAHFADCLEFASGRKVRSLAGAGAAGGTAFGFSAAFGAEIISGFEWMSGILNLEKRLESCDLLITGEGRIDESSLQGKVVGSLRNLCLAKSKQIIYLAGALALSPAFKAEANEHFVNAASPGAIAGLADIAAAVSSSLKCLYSKS
ncbi:MAG: glycerate kinase [Candidatus Obscuribacterales bacterium]|nr:glycerate kinase [Candidatus Obscuribacterales bacterium]